MSSRFLTRIPALAGVLLCTQALSAQTAPTGSIGGLVFRQDEGTPVPARVWLVGAARPAVPNARGSFRFDRLPPGRYHLRATFIGFVPVDTILSVSTGAHLRLVIGLKARPVELTAMTIREAAKPPETVKPSPPAKLKKPVLECGRLVAVSLMMTLCTSPQMLPRTTVHRDKEFLGSNSLILRAAQEAVPHVGFVTERLIQVNDRTWLITARDASRPEGIGSLRVEVEETGAHDTTVRVSLTSAVSVDRREQRDRAQAYLSTIGRNLR